MAAILAAVFSGLAWRAAHRQAESADRQLKMAQDADQKSEAAHVSAWLVMHRQVAKVYVRNGNGGPVYDVHCAVHLKPQEPTEEAGSLINIWADTWTALSPAAADVNDDEKIRLSIDGNAYNPEGEWRWEVKSNRHSLPLAQISSMKHWTLRDGGNGAHGLAVELEFRDSTGKKWKRSYDGRLLAQEEPDYAVGVQHSSN
ncbi:hypothetical protein J2T22_004083 [Pseudarthrobacter defluvii]|uniref:Pilin/secretion family protein with methylation motif n=1 Tax=Pseudarthrobacter defluvii TaxID=410837 RepID=A0ABT9UML8_9MICC|nr:hypothetical protein [Pseudarthrobacter defluvii]MDQ0120873.1 hypothetical protein [Pseudarthrobacter defluvii]